MNQCCYKYKNH